MTKTMPPAPAAPATMPSPFIRGRETESGRRDELLKAAPTVAQVRAETAAVVAEAERLKEDALARLAQREHDVEVLRSYLGDERKGVSNANFWRGQAAAIEAQIVAGEATLVDTAKRFLDLDAPGVWSHIVGRLTVLREELVQVRIVAPIVEAELEKIRSKRAALQEALGFVVRGVAANGVMEGEPEEPAPIRHEWRDAPGGMQRLQPVET
jgi:hypothetical protein